MISDAATVLIIEDDAQIALSLRSALANEGFRALLARNAQVAVQVLEERAPEVVLIDTDAESVDSRTLDGAHPLRGYDGRLIVAACSSVKDAGRELVPVALFQKPVELTKVMRAVRSVAGE